MMTNDWVLKNSKIHGLKKLLIQKAEKYSQLRQEENQENVVSRKLKKEQQKTGLSIPPQFYML